MVSCIPWLVERILGVGGGGCSDVILHVYPQAEYPAASKFTSESVVQSGASSVLTKA